jgi:hypothetical protein
MWINLWIKLIWFSLMRELGIGKGLGDKGCECGELGMNKGRIVDFLVGVWIY